MASAPPNTRTAILYDPRVSWKTMLRLILGKCGINAPRSDIEGMMRRLETHLKRELKQQRSVALLIDEAQTLSDDLLEQLRLLSNLEADQEKILQIVLAGQSRARRKTLRSKVCGSAAADRAPASAHAFTCGRGRWLHKVHAAKGRISGTGAVR